MANASTGHYAPLHREQRLDDMDERIKREGLSAFGMDNDPAKWRQGLVEKEPGMWVHPSLLTGDDPVARAGKPESRGKSEAQNHRRRDSGSNWTPSNDKAARRRRRKKQKRKKGGRGVKRSSASASSSVGRETRGNGDGAAAPAAQPPSQVRAGL